MNKKVMKRIIISEDERKRILGMHEDATKRHYGLVKEQETPFTDAGGNVYNWRAIKDQETLDKLLNEVSNIDKITELLGGKGKIFGSDYGGGGDGAFNIDKNNGNQLDNFLKNINNGVKIAAMLGKRLNGNDLLTAIQSNIYAWKDTEDRFDKNPHSTDLYAAQINNIIKAISDKLKLEPKLF